MGKFLKNIAVFLKDMMDVLLLLAFLLSCHFLPFIEDRVANSPRLSLVTGLSMRLTNWVSMLVNLLFIKEKEVKKSGSVYLSDPIPVPMKLELKIPHKVYLTWVQDE